MLALRTRGPANSVKDPTHTTEQYAGLAGITIGFGGAWGLAGHAKRVAGYANRA